MVIIEQDGFFQTAENGKALDDGRHSNLVVMTYGALPVIANIHAEFIQGETFEKSAKESLVKQIPPLLKPLQQYLDSRGFWYQTNVAQGTVFIPNAPESLEADLRGDLRISIVGHVRELQEGERFTPVSIDDLAKMKLY